MREIRPLEKYAQITRNEHPDIYFLSDDVSIFKSDKDQAVKIAQQCLFSISKEELDLTKEYLLSTFELWKIEYGVPVQPPKKLKYPMGMLGYAIRNFDDYDPIERFEGVEHIKPWEAAPRNSQTPIGLLNYLYSSNYKELKKGKL